MSSTTGKVGFKLANPDEEKTDTKMNKTQKPWAVNKNVESPKDDRYITNWNALDKYRKEQDRTDELMVQL